MRNSLMVLLMCFFFGEAVQAQVRREIKLYMRSNVGTDSMHDGRILRVYGITPALNADPDIPAPTIRCREGDTVVLDVLSISQQSHHSIHLHGLDVDTRNDGDPATSFYLVHLQDTTYTFVARHAGTYIYHCHVDDVVDVQMGMYGLIVVEPKTGGNQAWTDGPHYSKSYEWLMSEIDPKWHDSIPRYDIHADTVNIPSYRPSYFLVNGKSEQLLDRAGHTRISGRIGDVAYIRAANIGFFSNRLIFPSWLTAQVIDSDGRPFAEAIRADSLLITPGERYGILLTLSKDLDDSIHIQYADLNTDSVWSTQFIRVNSDMNDVGVNGQQQDIDCYPNPAADILHIKGASPGQRYSIIDVMARPVTSGLIRDHSIDVSMLSTGSYFLVLDSSSIRSFTIAR